MLGSDHGEIKLLKSQVLFYSPTRRSYTDRVQASALTTQPSERDDRVD